MTSFSFKNSTASTTAQTLTDDDTATTPASDDTGTIDSTSSLIVATGTAVALNIAAAPVGAGIVINNAGTLQSNNGRTIDTGKTSAAPGSKISITNTGTIFNNAGSSGNDDAIRIYPDLVSGVFLLYNTGTIGTNGAVSDSVAVRLGGVYTAKTVTIDNGIDANGNINTTAMITTADADAVRPGGVNTSGTATGYGSSVVNNYGTISASYQTGYAGVILSKVNGIDIGAGQAATVNNYDTIVGDESGLGADNTAGTILFAPTYYVTNNVGATITGNNGPGIAIGSNTSASAPSTTSTITNYGTITGKATGVGRTQTGGVAPTVSVANGTGIFSAYAVTIVNGSGTNATATITGSGIIGAPAAAQQGSTTTYYGINIANGSVTNYGVISETTATNAGAAIFFSGSAASTLTNYGTITGANGLAITMGSGNDTINLYTGGTITGKIDGGAGTDTLTLNLAAGTTTGTLGNVANVEILSVLGGTWTINDTESYANGITINSAAGLVLGQSAVLTGAIADNGALTLTDAGAFTLANAVTGIGKLTQAGAGTATLNNGSDSYSGGTTISSGTLDVAALQAAGTGTIAFGATNPTLAIEQAALSTSGSAGTFSNTLSGFAAGDMIDLKGIGTATAASYNASTNQLSVTGGPESVTLQFDATGAVPAGFIYAVGADAGATGTDVLLDADPIVASLSANPSSGYERATQTFTISIVTNKVVSVSGNGPTLDLSDGGTATLTSSASTANSTTLTFTATIAQGQNANGVSITSVSNGATVTDAYGAALDFTNALNQATIGPTIDTTAPTLAITSAAGVTNQTTQTITGTADDISQPLYVYEGSNATLATYTGGGNWSATVTLSGNGTHTFYAQETDAAGNVGTSGSVTYTLQSTGPSVTLTAGQGGTTNQSMQTVTGMVDVASDAKAVGTPVTILNGTTSVGTGTVASSGAFSANVTLPSDGTYSLKAADTDTAGNTGFSTTISYTLDTMPPDTSITTEPAANSNTASATFTYTGTDTAGGTGVASYMTEIDSAGFVSTTAASATYMGLADGQHTFQVEAVDEAGNIDPTPATYSFLVDTTPPDTTITADPASDSNSKSASFTYTGTDSGSGVVSYKTSLDGSTFVSTTSTTASYTGLADGQHTFMVEAVDAAGNVDPTPASDTFTVDTMAPVVGINNAGGATNQTSQTITGTVDAADANSLVTLSVNGSVVTQTTANAQGVFSANVTLGTDGTYVVKASDTDGAANTGSASVTFQLDTVAPDVDFTTADETVSTPEQTVSGTVDTADAGTIVTVYEGTNALGTAIVGSNGMWSTSVVLSGNGTHTLVAKDTDAAGNIGASDPVNLTLDTTAPQFTKGNLVLSISGDGDGSGEYGDNEATPVVLEQVTTDGTFVNQLILPQSTIGANSVFSGEYGSSSEGSLELSADGKSLTIAGYAINADVYNTGGAAVYGNAALAQSTSLTTQSTYTPVGRVIADISSTGVVDTSTVLFNVFNTNNPRSVATINGSSFYITGQGVSGDTTQGVFYVQDGSSSPTAIYTGTDTRTAEIYNGVLYVSTDSKQPKSGGTSDIASYGALPTTATTPVVLTGISKSVTLTAAQTNTINAAGETVDLDPENFFFANSTTLYVADGGIPKQGGIGDGGLQKWSYNGTSWVLDYTLSQGLGIAASGATYGTTGLIGLTGKVVGNTVELYATNQTVGDLDQKYLFGIDDQLNATSGAGESFTTLVTAAADTNIRGIAFAPSTAAPVVAITTNGGLTNKPMQTVSGTVDVADSGTTVLVVENGATLGSALVGTDGTWTTNVTLTGDGTHTLDATDTDAYGNIGTSGTLVFTLDTMAPTTPAAPMLVDDTGSSATDNITSNPTIAYATPASSDTLLYALGTGAYSTTVPSFTSDGTYTVSTEEEDAAGNISAPSSLTFTLDTTAPAPPAAPVLADDTGASNTDNITSNPTITYATPASGDTLLYALGTGTYSTTVPSFTSDGTYTVSTEEEDVAGNISGPSSLTFTLDTTPPVVTIAAPATNSSISAIDPTISGSVDAADAGSSVILSMGGTTIGTAAVAADGSWSDHLTFAGDGTYTIAATDTDAAGNVGQASDTFTINSTPNQSLFGTLTHDVTSAGGQIYALYETILGRAPDALGLEGWVAALGSGTPLSTIAQDFLGSPEYANDYGSSVTPDSGFINQLYEDGLHRAAEPSGLEGWETALASGTSRAQVAIDIATSQESDTDLAATFQAGVFVPSSVDSAIARLYYGLLDRAPDAGGLANWEGAAANGTSLAMIASDFIASPEYANLNGTPTNSQFVTALYEGALGRADTDPGGQGWVNALNQGATRASVALGIAESAEATTHLAPAIQTGFHIA